MSSPRTEKDLDALNGRFIEAMEALGYTGYSLSKDLGTSEAVISNIRNRKNPPNVQLVRELLNKHLELDPDWLLFGRGAMTRTDQPKAGNSSTTKGETDLLKSIEQRMGKLEDLLTRSLHIQLERDVVEGETMADLDERIASIEKQLNGARKVPDRRS